MVDRSEFFDCAWMAKSEILRNSEIYFQISIKQNSYDAVLVFITIVSATTPFKYFSLFLVVSESAMHALLKKSPCTSFVKVIYEYSICNSHTDRDIPKCIYR